MNIKVVIDVTEQIWLPNVKYLWIAVKYGLQMLIFEAVF